MTDLSEKPLVVASNQFNEIEQVEEWYENVCHFADAGIVVVDNGSTDGTKEFYESKDNVVYITDDIILREGYGPARNHLREMARVHFPKAKWCLYLDADERIMPEDFHTLRFLKDYLISEYDVIALPRLNRLNKHTMDTKVDFHIHPDFQARMSRLDSNLRYVRKLHEQIVGFNKIYGRAWPSERSWRRWRRLRTRGARHVSWKLASTCARGWGRRITGR